MKFFHLFIKVFRYVLLGFAVGVVCTTYILSYSQSQTIMTNTVLSILSENNQSKKCSSAEIKIDTENIPHIYEEFYKFYELNKEW